MSCVAEPNAASNANQTIGISAIFGSDSAMPIRPQTIIDCDSSSQLRRRPNRRVSSGMGKRSTSGAQHHLKPYARPTHDKYPIVERLTPASRNQKLSVPSTRSSGNPAENPSASMRNEGGSR